MIYMDAASTRKEFKRDVTRTSEAKQMERFGSKHAGENRRLAEGLVQKRSFVCRLSLYAVNQTFSSISAWFQPSDSARRREAAMIRRREEKQKQHLPHCGSSKQRNWRRSSDHRENLRPAESLTVAQREAKALTTAGLFLAQVYVISFSRESYKINGQKTKQKQKLVIHVQRIDRLWQIT